MKKARQVVIFDDEDGRREAWIEKLGAVSGFSEHFETRRVGKREFSTDLGVLRRRRKNARNEKRKQIDLDYSGTLFDDAAILFVDYDLFDLIEDTNDASKTASETGEEVAYLARCFSTCGLIIAINQFARENITFDLTLQGHPDSFADLNLLDEQIFNPGLWSTPWRDFRPWYWPHLPKAVESFEQRVCEAELNLDVEILDFLEVPPEVREIFPLSALEFISGEGSATFRQFVLNSGKALRHNDQVVSSNSIARVASSRLFKCLERLVLPGQNILVDAAHLLERYPSLFLVESPERLIDWQRVHELLDPGETTIDLTKIEACRFTRSSWLSRAAWYWSQVGELESIKEVADPWSPRQQIAFCEDTSRFVPPEEAVEFVAKVDSPFVRRFVSERNARYGPRLQFAL